jgi:hypothetical protein
MPVEAKAAVAQRAIAALAMLPVHRAAHQPATAHNNCASLVTVAPERNECEMGAAEQGR